MYNTLHVFLTEKCMPKEHKNVQKFTKCCILLYSRILEYCCQNKYNLSNIQNELIKRTMRMCACANNHYECVNKCLDVLMLLELIKMCEQHIDFSFKCFLWGFGIFIACNCFSLLWIWTTRYISFRSYLLLKDIAKIFL